MPWCPKCKNEYKAGYTVCADCGCNLMDELGEEIIAYFGTEKEVDDLIEYLESNGFDFAVKKYNSREGHYEVLIQESKKDSIAKVMRDFFTRTKAFEVSSQDTMSAADYIDDDIESVNIKRYKKPGERAAEYKSGYQTMFLVGGIGLIALILVDLGIIPIYFAKESKILINIVMGGMFIAFIVIGIASLKTYKKLVVQSNDDEELEEKIIKWFSESVTLDMLTSKENKKESEEILFFNRFKTIKKMIKQEFEDIDPSFLEYLTDKLYNEMFK